METFIKKMMRIRNMSREEYLALPDGEIITATMIRIEAKLSGCDLASAMDVLRITEHILPNLS